MRVADFATELPPASVFPSVGDASAFFATGACGLFPVRR